MEDVTQSLGIGVLIVLLVALVAVFAVAVFLLVKLVRMFSVVRAETMPIQGKVAFWAALAYTIFPVDVLPDPVYLDDIGVLGGALAFLGHLVSKYHVSASDGEEGPEALDKGAPASTTRGTRPPLDR